jgi:hypothetical protein
MLPILGDFEVSFRNALHRALSQYFGNVDSYDWMMPQPNPARLNNPAADEFLPPRHKMPKKSRDNIVEAIRKVKEKKPGNYVVTPDDVVAALPFGFWEVLISGLTHSAQPAGIQSTILGTIFSHAPNQSTVPYGDPAFTRQVMQLLKRIRDVRNRIGHHDAIWTIAEFNHQGTIGFIPRRPRHTINSIRIFLNNICWFAGWIDPHIPTYIKNSDHWWSIQALLQRKALVTYRCLGGKMGTYRAVLDAVEPFQRNKKNQKKPKFHQRLVENRYFF